MLSIKRKSMQSVNEVALDMGILSLSLLTLWLYLPGFLANTFAMMWGKWLPKTGYGPWPIDGGRNWRDGNRLLGDGKNLEWPYRWVTNLRIAVCSYSRHYG